MAARYICYCPTLPLALAAAARPHCLPDNPSSPPPHCCHCSSLAGCKEVTVIPAKPGIAFVEFEGEMQATVAMTGLQGFKVTPQNAMKITYSK